MFPEIPDENENKNLKYKNYMKSAMKCRLTFLRNYISWKVEKTGLILTSLPINIIFYEMP